MSGKADTMQDDDWISGSPLPFEPESRESIRGRFNLALSRVFDLSSPEKLAAIESAGFYPGKFRRHVFDFSNGMRWVVLRELVPQFSGLHSPSVHILATFRPGSMSHSQIKRTADQQGRLIEMIRIFHTEVKAAGCPDIQHGNIKPEPLADGIHIFECSEAVALRYEGKPGTVSKSL